MGYILGISAFYHDSAAALTRDGEIIAAAQEERFSRKKFDARFPRYAINYCLGEAFIEPSELDAVVFYDNPVLTLDRVVKNAISVAPAGRDQFIAASRALLGPKARLGDQLESILGQTPRLLTTYHHLAHAASCFYPSSFNEAAILTVDGVGEWATCTLAMGRGTEIDIIKEVNYPHSLGLLYNCFTYYCGFNVNSDEYKLMGLAPYGEPRYASLIRDTLIDIRDDGSFRLNLDYFGFRESPVMTNECFDRLFGGPARKPAARITRREMDLAASIQKVVEEALVKLAAHATRITGCRNLAMAGGVALNCVANGHILRQIDLDGFFAQPAAGDAGGALGAALLATHREFGVPRRTVAGGDSLKGSLLGPAFSADEIAAFVERTDATGHRIDDPDERARSVAHALADGHVVALLSGRMEFGPRALGARSILGDPRQPNMQSRMNMKIKFRESFRPFAPAVLEEFAADYFDLEGTSPYMLIVAPVRDDRRLPEPVRAHETDDLAEILRRPRSEIPAVTHVDHSARIQTVGEAANPEFRRILKAFHELTGCPVLINTSFNLAGEPIVCTPEDAYQCFMNSDIDLLVLEDQLLWKSQQALQATHARREKEYEPL